MNTKSTESRETNLFKVYFWALSFTKPYIRNTILIITCGLMLSLIELLIPKFIQYFIDIILPNQDYKLFMYCLIGILFLFIVKFGTSSAKELLERNVSENAGKDLQVSMLRHLRKLGFSYFERTSVGATLSLLNTEVAAVQKLYRLFFPSTIQFTLFSLVSIVLMIQMSFELTLVVIPALLLYYTVGPRIEKKATITANELVTSQHQLGQKHYESISSLLEIKAYNVWRWDLQKTMSQSENSTKLYTQRYWYAHLRGTIRRLSYYIGAIILFIYGFNLIKANAITVGEFVAFLLYYFNAMHRLTTVITLITEQKVLMLQALRLYSFVNVIPEVEEHPNPVPLRNPKGEIVFKNVHFSYNVDHNQILEDVNFHIKPGERVALVGQSGGGKSSILKLIARFYDPKSGEIWIDGIPIKSISFEDLRGSMGIVFQENYLFGDSVLENIRFGSPNASDEEIIEAAKAVNLHDNIMDLPNGYSTLIGERGVKLSGGQKQRMAIARLLIKNPSIVLLDEATSALDYVSERLVIDTLNIFLEGRTTVTIAHRLSTIREYDKIIAVDKGRVVEMGSYDELIRRQGYFYSLAKSYDEREPVSL